MQYERSLMAQWDEYARNKTAVEEGLKEGIKEGKELGIKESKEIFVRNLLAANQFTFAEIATYAGVSEDFVLKVKKDIK